MLLHVYIEQFLELIIHFTESLCEIIYLKNTPPRPPPPPGDCMVPICIESETFIIKYKT